MLANFTCKIYLQNLLANFTCKFHACKTCLQDMLARYACKICLQVLLAKFTCKFYLQILCLQFLLAIFACNFCLQFLLVFAFLSFRFVKEFCLLNLNLQPPTEKNGMVTALKSKAQELGFAFKSGNHTILLCRWPVSYTHLTLPTKRIV